MIVLLETEPRQDFLLDLVSKTTCLIKKNGREIQWCALKIKIVNKNAEKWTFKVKFCLSIVITQSVFKIFSYKKYHNKADPLPVILSPLMRVCDVRKSCRSSLNEALSKH